ncbi:MAG: DNA internalization-related competence protein ComEC/Rec2, partial [Burkholderiales bacterium]
MLLNVLAFVAGVSLLQVQSELPHLAGAFALIPLAAIAVVLKNYRWAKWFAIGGAFFAAGFCWAAFLAAARLAETLPATLEGVDLNVTGVVASLPHNLEQGTRFEFDVERSPHEVPERISLSWYRADRANEPPPDIHPGQHWRLTVRLKRPHGTVNPHGFDFEAWALERNLRATGYVREEGAIELIEDFVPKPRYWVENVRERIRENFSADIGERPYAGILIALAIGDQRAILKDQWQVFTRTGVNHLMSISGLHVTMVSGLVFACAYWLWVRLPRLVFPAIKVAAIAGALAAIGYAALAGFAVPAQRTVYMLLAVAAALFMGRTSMPAAALAAALFLVVVLDPWAVLSAGFWLSFGAVALIVYVSVARLRAPRWFTAWTRMQWAITLGLVPLMLVLFQQTSIVSPIANAIAIPLVSLVVVPLTLLATFPALDFLLVPAHAVMGLCMAVLEFLSAMPSAVWQQHAPPWWALIVAALGALWLLAPRGTPARYAGAAGFLPLFLAFPPGPANGDFSLAVLDVGQGLAVVARTHKHALLYDAGPEYSSDRDAGERVVVPYLRGAGIARLDRLIVSHDDTDHSGGADSVLQALPVDALSSSLYNSHAIAARMENKAPCHSGQSWEWDGVRFEMLHPKLESYADFKLKDNARGCVLKISSQHGSALLTADIEQREEHELLARDPEVLRADVLIAPHHGSKSSSNEKFVRQVNPKTVIFSAGYRNRFGHPRPEVVERYRAIGAELLRTDHDGALLLDFSPLRISARKWRLERPRYWHAN